MQANREALEEDTVSGLDYIVLESSYNLSLKYAVGPHGNDSRGWFINGSLVTAPRLIGEDVTVWLPLTDL